MTSFASQAKASNPITTARPNDMAQLITAPVATPAAVARTVDIYCKIADARERERRLREAIRSNPKPKQSDLNAHWRACVNLADLRSKL